MALVFKGVSSFFLNQGSMTFSMAATGDLGMVMVTSEGYRKTDPTNHTDAQVVQEPITINNQSVTPSAVAWHSDSDTTNTNRRRESVVWIYFYDNVNATMSIIIPSGLGTTHAVAASFSGDIPTKAQIEAAQDFAAAESSNTGVYGQTLSTSRMSDSTGSANWNATVFPYGSILILAAHHRDGSESLTSLGVSWSGPPEGDTITTFETNVGAHSSLISIDEASESTGSLATRSATYVQSGTDNNDKGHTAALLFGIPLIAPTITDNEETVQDTTPISVQDTTDPVTGFVRATNNAIGIMPLVLDSVVPTHTKERELVDGTAVSAIDAVDPTHAVINDDFAEPVVDTISAVDAVTPTHAVINDDFTEPVVDSVSVIDAVDPTHTVINDDFTEPVTDTVSALDAVTPTHEVINDDFTKDEVDSVPAIDAVDSTQGYARKLVDPTAVSVADEVDATHAVINDDFTEPVTDIVSALDAVTPTHTVINDDFIEPVVDSVSAQDAVDPAHTVINDDFTKDVVDTISAVDAVVATHDGVFDNFFKSVVDNTAVGAADSTLVARPLTNVEAIDGTPVSTQDAVDVTLGYSLPLVDATAVESADIVSPTHTVFNDDFTQDVVDPTSVSAFDAVDPTHTVINDDFTQDVVDPTSVSVADSVDSLLLATRDAKDGTAVSAEDSVDVVHIDNESRALVDPTPVTIGDLVSELVGEFTSRSAIDTNPVASIDAVKADASLNRALQDFEDQTLADLADGLFSSGRELVDNEVSVSDSVLEDHIQTRASKDLTPVDLKDDVDVVVENNQAGTKHSLDCGIIGYVHLGRSSVLNKSVPETATGDLSLLFDLDSPDGLEPNQEGPGGNLVTNINNNASTVTSAVGSLGLSIPCSAEGGIVGLTISLGVNISGGTGAGGGAGDGGFGGVHVIPEDIIINIPGSVSIGGANLDADGEVVIPGDGDVDGTLNALWLDNEVIIQGKGSVISDFLTNGELMSVEEVWNTALTQLGVTTIGSTSDQSPQATLLNGVWNGGFRTKFLADHTWNGGKRTAELAKYVDNPTGGRWNYAFTLPSDYIRALRVNGKQNVPDSYNAASSGGSGGRNIWEIEVVANDSGTLARCLLTGEQAVALEYMFDVGDVNIDLLAPMTRWAMGLALAAHAAPNFGKSTSDIQMLEAKAQDAIVAAKGVDGQEGTSQMFQSTSLLDCRY